MNRYWGGMNMTIPLMLAGVVFGCSRGGAAPKPPEGGVGEVRPPAVAGQFYDRSPEALKRSVTNMLAQAKRADAPGALRAAVVPHAGYVYSGKCAASVYRLLRQGQYDRVIILGPSHSLPFRGVALPPTNVTAYATPLGEVPLDMAVCRELAKAPGIGILPEMDSQEHSIEVQLPFLQSTLGEFHLVPLLCGALTGEDVVRAGRALARYVDARTLLLASSDFTHFGAGFGFTPFEKDVPEHLRSWLQDSAGMVAALDVEGFTRHLAETGDTICGQGPIRILMTALQGSGETFEGKVLDCYTSGDLTGDYGHSVSYAAVGFFGGAAGQAKKEAGSVKEHKSGTWTPGLSDEERKTLMAIAKDTLVWAANGGKGAFRLEAYSLTPKMKEEMATFVTLKKRGDLRGCIGSLAPVEALYQSVHHNAIQASLHDYRFQPVQPAELKDLELDVSILSPIRDIASLDDFKLGQQGIILEKGMNRAVFLPEVAVEQGWTKEETLSYLSRKAGMEQDEWRKGARFKVFESVVLSEP